jgi:hypothetical protein
MRIPPLINRLWSETLGIAATNNLSNLLQSSLCQVRNAGPPRTCVAWWISSCLNQKLTPPTNGLSSLVPGKRRVGSTFKAINAFFNCSLSSLVAFATFFLFLAPLTCYIFTRRKIIIFLKDCNNNNNISL